MILYLDTSSLVKLYVEEDHSSDVREWCDEAMLLATSRVAYPEFLSALTRRHNAGDLRGRAFEMLVGKFTSEWGKFVSLDFDEIRAGELVAKHGIRGFDAVHLSSALTLTTDNQDVEIAFSSFDKKLNAAAAAEGFPVRSAGE